MAQCVCVSITEDLIYGLGRAKFITTLDLSRGYWQVPVAKSFKHLTAFTTPFGLYQFRACHLALKVHQRHSND